MYTCFIVMIVCLVIIFFSCIHIKNSDDIPNPLIAIPFIISIFALVISIIVSFVEPHSMEYIPVKVEYIYDVGTKIIVVTRENKTYEFTDLQSRKILKGSNFKDIKYKNAYGIVLNKTGLNYDYNGETK